MRFWWAHLDELNFKFDGFGESEYAAIMALKAGWEEHRKQRPDVLDWETLREHFDIRMLFVPESGTCFRDGQCVTLNLDGLECDIPW